MYRCFLHVFGHIEYIILENSFNIFVILMKYSTPSLIRTGVSIKKKSGLISEFFRISEVIHLYGEFCSESL